MQLNQQELKIVDEFRQSRKTVVLTILFTDIVGYTKFTESSDDIQSNHIRKIHDDLFNKIDCEI